MHHFSVASLVELTAAGDGFEWAMLAAIAENSWLLSSGFAEGRPGQHILTPTMRGTVVDDGLRISGVKKPCSLTWSMDLMSRQRGRAPTRTGARTGSPSSSSRPSPRGSSVGASGRAAPWPARRATRCASPMSIVPDALIFYPDDGDSMDPIQARGFVWFELLVSASYLGAASRLVERVLELGKGSAEDRANLAIEVGAASAALEHVAASAAGSTDNDDLLARALYARYATERTIERVVMSASALAGGMAFIGSSEISYLLGATRALAFHPPSRAAASAPLAQFLDGAPLAL